MSHQVIITFDIDEAKIQENAEKEAGRQIANQVIDGAFGRSYSKDSLMREYVQKAIKELLEPHKDEIIDAAIRNVTESLHRTKVVKEALTAAMEDDGR